ncbi:MAG: phytanoyl-CoA dioxygenase family protein [candidate division Zixibacteria bacterium]|nr:phytanoyl-CoA dioxygenase family protein [candidate division Zixibacteria bacterium]
MRGQDNPIIDRLVRWKPAWDAFHAMELSDFTSHESYIILSKPPGGPPLYWHQDWIQWNDPISLAPWPQYLFLSYYLVDTTLENGCFRIIPGTHRKRHPLHDAVLVAHQTTSYFSDITDPVMFGNPPDAVDLPVRAGSLVIGEGRALHAARGNNSDKRRTLLLGWTSRPATVPAYWKGNVPEPIVTRPTDVEYKPTRVPGNYLV